MIITVYQKLLNVQTGKMYKSYKSNVMTLIYLPNLNNWSSHMYLIDDIIQNISVIDIGTLVRTWGVLQRWHLLQTKDEKFSDHKYHLCIFIYLAIHVFLYIYVENKNFTSYLTQIMWVNIWINGKLWTPSYHLLP